MLRPCLGACWLAAALAPPAPSASVRGVAVPLASGGRAAATVVLPAQPSPVEVSAATEFVRLVKGISGAELPVVNETAAGVPSGALVFLGNVSSLGAAGLADAQLLPEGSAAVTRRTADGSPALFLLGDDACQPWVAGDRGSPTSNGPCRSGTLFGVVTFFREVFGCEWLWPGPLGEVLPTWRDLSVPAMPSVVRRPEVAPPMLRRYRGVYSNAARVSGWRALVPWVFDAKVVAQLAASEEAWLNTAMMMGSHDFPDTGHAFGGWWPKYHEAHPEYFALLPPNTIENPVSGHDIAAIWVAFFSGCQRYRRWQGPVAIRAPPRWHLSDKAFHASQVKMCVSNTEVWSQLVQSYSGGPGLSACEDDGSVGFCQCSRCRAWDPPGKGMGRDRGGQGDCVGLNAKVLDNCTGSYSDRYV